MDYSFNDLKNAASLIQKSVFGKKSEYELKFNHEADGCWYVDFPDWPFDHHNLMMVAGADDLCEFLSHSLTGGAHYEVNGIAGFTKKIWLCPVTLFVLGNYPAYIYLKKNV